MVIKKNYSVKIKSPGRVCIIGEHTDYSGGLSISCAIDRYTTIYGRTNTNSCIEVSSKTFDLTPVIGPVLNLGSKPFENQYQIPWPQELVAYSLESYGV